MCCRRFRREEKLSFKYDREADILYIDKRPPYSEQESEELDVSSHNFGEN